MKQRALVFMLALLLCMTLVSCRSQTNSNSESSAGDNQPETTSGSPSSAEEIPQEDPSKGEASNGTEASEEPSAVSQEGTEQPGATVADSVDTEIPPESDLADAEFSFQVDSLSLTLRESGIDEKIAELPFEFISDITEELGEGSDTFAGSFLRTVKFDGLELTLFAPKDNPEQFWVMQMTASVPGIYSYRGVQVGDTRGMLLDVYPEAELIPDGSGTEIYRYAVSEFEELTLMISDDTISQISLTYYMP